MRRILILCVLATTFVPSAAHSWESDMHYGLTKWLAWQAGYKEDAAEVMAGRSESVDGHIVDAVTLMVLYACLANNKKDAEQASEMVRDNHFPTFAIVGQPPAKREVFPDKAASLKHATDLAARPSSALPNDMRKFGDALHVVMDAWSHQGIPDVPQVLGLAKCDPDYAWGHPKTRGGWSEHTADITSAYPLDAYKAAQTSYRLLEQFLKQNPSLNAGGGRDWSKIEQSVRAFIAAKTKTEKRRWFEKEKFKDFSFLYRTNIPDGTESFLTVRTVGRKIEDRVLSTLAKVDVPRRIQDFFDKFFMEWATSDDFERIAATYADPAAMMNFMRLSAASGQQATQGVAAALGLWRLSDHGSFVTEAGHRPGTTAVAWSAAFNKLGGRDAVARYGSVETAFVPISIGPDRRVPHLAIPVPPERGLERDLFIGLARFRHAPNDTLVVTVRDKGKPAVVSIQSVAEH